LSDVAAVVAVQDVAPNENPPVGLSGVAVKAGAAPNENPPVGLSGVAVLEGAAPNEKELKQEGIEGVFNKNCMISYPNYKFIFCIWALNKFSTMIDSK
jgi:squalene cyclase